MVKDEDVKIVHTFRRQTELAPDNQDTEEIQKQLDEKYVGKSYIFEWNINSDEDELRMVLITDCIKKEKEGLQTSSTLGKEY